MPKVRSVWPWVVMAPFGRPVVPEVKMMSERSPGPTARQAAITSCGVGPAAHQGPLPLDHALGTGQEFVPAEDGDLVGPGRLGEGALVVVTEEDDPLEGGDVLLLEHRRVVDPEEAPDAEEGPGPRALQHVGRLGTLEAGVQRDEDGPRPEEPERGEDPLGHVRGPDRHPVARARSPPPWPPR